VFNIGPLELIVISILVLLVFGPKRLPEVARAIGRGLQEFRKAQTEVQETLRTSLEDAIPPEPVPTNGPDAATSPETPEAADASDVARTLGRGLAEIRRTREELQRTFRIDLNELAPDPSPPEPARRPGSDERDRSAGERPGRSG
jgi:TatA/E family protein of Tat protein translocase